jgi:hypothetical protein
MATGYRPRAFAESDPDKPIAVERQRTDNHTVGQFAGQKPTAALSVPHKGVTFMKGLIRIAVVVALAALPVLGPTVTAHASSKVTIDFSGTPSGGYDFLKGCTGSAPYSCYTDPGSLDISMSLDNLTQPITIGYTTVNGTALAGRDYVATSGYVTIQPNAPYAFLSIPLIINGDPPGTDLQFSAEITSTSLPATISGSPAPEIIINGGNFPWGCNLSRSTAPTISATCTGQPPTTQWNINTDCYVARGIIESGFGNVVTGDGTSTVTCPNGETAEGQGYQVDS